MVFFISAQAILHVPSLCSARHVRKVVWVIGGDPAPVEVAPPTSSIGGWPVRKSERVTVPWMLGNTGGGKDPCFWCAGERGNRAVIDDESTTPRNTDDLSIPLCRSAKREILGAVARHHVVWTARVGAAVKPVGKLDVRNGHVQLCVQRRLVCSVGDKPHRGKSQK